MVGVQEISTDDSLLDVRYDENAGILPSQAQGNSYTSGTVGGNGTAIDGGQGVLWWGAAVGFSGGQNTDFRTRVNQIADASQWITAVKQAARTG